MNNLQIIDDEIKVAVTKALKELEETHKYAIRAHNYVD